MKLKYGMNPNQDTAEVLDPHNALEILNGLPSMINMLDGLNAWPLVKELKAWSGKPAAASFKHVTPSGVALGGTLTETERKAYMVAPEITSELAAAYARARGADRLASFGDFVALSDKVDSDTAQLIRSEVSDGIIAPGYDAEALEILKSKKGGKYIVLQIDPAYVPSEMESREVYGITLKQKRNLLQIDESLLTNIVTENKSLSDAVKKDMILGMITLKYTMSNSVCLVKNGQVIGIGSGQQSRILCTKLAAGKANVWYQRMLLAENPPVFPEGSKRTAKDQLVEQAREERYGENMFLGELGGISLCSDAFFPQKDNIHFAQKAGIKYIASPMGSIRDNEIIETCNAYGMSFVNTGIRLFHH